MRKNNIGLITVITVTIIGVVSSIVVLKGKKAGD